MMTLAFLLVLQDASPEESYRKIEESIVKARSVMVRFRVEGSGAKEGADRDLRASGTMTLKEGGRIRLDCTMNTGSEDRKTLLLGDGKKLSLTQGGAAPQVVDAAKGTEGTAALLLAQLGAIMTSFMPVGAGNPAGTIAIELSAFKAGEDDGAARTVHFTTTNKMKGKVISTSDTRLWWDPKTGKPLKRVLTLKKGDAVQGTITETYEAFELNAEVADDLFKIEVPARKDDK